MLEAVAVSRSETFYALLRKGEKFSSLSTELARKSHEKAALRMQAATLNNRFLFSFLHPALQSLSDESPQHRLVEDVPDLRQGGKGLS